MILVNRSRFLGQRSFPVVNLGRRFLGQEVSQPNRLLDIRTSVILSRGQMIFPSEMQKSLAYAKNNKNLTPLMGQVAGPVDINDWTSEERDLLEQVAANPSQEELDDLAMIDTFFGGMYCKGTECYRGTPYQGQLTVLQIMCARPDWRKTETYLRYYADNSGYFEGIPPWQGQEYNEYQARLKSAISDPFYCSPWIGGNVIPGWVPSKSKAGTKFGISSELGLDVSKPWKEIKLPLQNAIIFMKVMKDYPFPSPISIMPQYWFSKVIGDVRNLIHQSVLIPPDLVKFWATMSIVATYNEVAKEIQDELRRRAEKKFIINIFTSILIGVGISLGIGILSAGIGGLIGLSADLVGKVLSSVNEIVNQFMSQQEKKQAAKDMEKVAQQFSETDAAFAKEVQDAADYLERVAAEEVRATPPTPEELADMEERRRIAEATPGTGGAFYDVPPPGGPDLLPVVGGVAAVGVLAVVLSMLK